MISLWAGMGELNLTTRIMFGEGTSSGNNIILAGGGTGSVPACYFAVSYSSNAEIDVSSTDYHPPNNVFRSRRRKTPAGLFNLFVH